MHRIVSFTLILGFVWFLLLPGEGLAAGSGARKKIISTEKSVKSKKGARATNIDFDSVDISGQRKMPMGSSILQSKGDKDSTLVKIRMDWQQEMIQSASGL